MDKNCNKFNLTKSLKEKVKDIVEISFYPRNEVAYKTLYKKGDKKWWKWLGLIPIFKYTASKGKYKTTFYTSSSLEGLAEAINYHTYVEGDKLWFQAKVIVRFINEEKEYHYFNTNEEALEYTQKLELYAKKLGIEWERADNV